MASCQVHPGGFGEVPNMPLPLEGRTVALAEGRQLEELAQMLEAEGACTLRCPLVSILDAPDAAAVVAWLREVTAGPMSLLILMTGEALRRLLGFADREGLREPFVAALGRTRTLTRGPKPVKALKEIGLNPTRVAAVPTTDGVIAALRDETLQGQTVGVTRYGDVNVALEQYLAGTGAVVKPVLPYVYAPAADDDRVADLVARLAGGTVDVLVFTSSPQVDRLFDVAAKKGLHETLRQGLGKTMVAAVGPIVADNLRKRQATVSICPEQGFVMKNLVQHIKRSFSPG
jgi:uroporphyrinogen-III synthase